MNPLLTGSLGRATHPEGFQFVKYPRICRVRRPSLDDASARRTTSAIKSSRPDGPDSVLDRGRNPDSAGRELPRARLQWCQVAMRRVRACNHDWIESSESPPRSETNASKLDGTKKTNAPPIVLLASERRNRSLSKNSPTAF